MKDSTRFPEIKDTESSAVVLHPGDYAIFTVKFRCGGPNITFDFQAIHGESSLQEWISWLTLSINTYLFSLLSTIPHSKKDRHGWGGIDIILMMLSGKCKSVCVENRTSDQARYRSSNIGKQ